MDLPRLMLIGLLPLASACARCSATGASVQTPPAAPTAAAGGFRGRFSARVDQLVAHPRVRVTHAALGPPAPPDVLAKVEAELGRPLPEDLRALYEESGSVSLSWVCLPPGAPPDHTRPDLSAQPEWREQPHHGVFFLHPVEEMFITGDYESDLWFEGSPELNALTVDGRPSHRRYLKRFDSGDGYSEAALLVEPDRADIRVAIGGDAFAEVGPRTIRVSRYLDLLIDNAGYQGDTHDDHCAGVEAQIGVIDPYDPAVPGTVFDPYYD